MDPDRRHVLILIGIKLWVTSPVKKATRQVDVLVEGIRKGEGDITRRIKVRSGDEIAGCPWQLMIWFHRCRR